MHPVGDVIVAGFLLLFALATSAKADGWRAWKVAVDSFAPTGGVAVLARYLIPVAEGAIAVALVTAPQVGLVSASAFLAGMGGTVLFLTGAHSGEPCNCFGHTAERQ